MASGAPVYFSLDGNNWTVTSSRLSQGCSLATVPGDIFTDLLRCGVLKEEPYWRYNDVEYRWVGETSWAYSQKFVLPAELLAASTTLLVLEGVDTVAQVSVNGQPLGYCDNMFKRWVFAVDAALLADAAPLLAVDVQFISAAAYAAAAAADYPYPLPAADNLTQQSGVPYRNYMRKEQCSFSWDWGPAFIPQGVWQPAYLVAFDGLALDDITVTVYPSQPTAQRSSDNDDDDSFNIHTRVSFFAAAPGGSGTLSFYLDGRLLATHPFASTGDDHRQHQTSADYDVFASRVALWYPRGYGEQRLYNYSVQFVPDDGGAAVWRWRRIGFRTVELVEHAYPLQHGSSMYFRVNGLPVFAKGANLIPLDSFESRVSAADVQRLLDDAHAANMNIVRVWGGGVYQQRALYERADELGLMVWQEFMFATSMAPRNAAFLASVADEVRWQVRRLASHACIVLWSGNNENEAALTWFPETLANRDLYVVDYAQLYYDTVLNSLLLEDQSRPFRPSSPSNGLLTDRPPFVGVWGNPSNASIGDVHYYNYDTLCLDVASFPSSRFVSEYGWQSFPSLRTWRPVTLPTDWSPYSPLMLHRQHHVNGTQQIDAMMGRLFPAPVRDDAAGAAGFSAWIYLSQAAQADCIRAQSEHYRRARDSPANTMGAIYWQLNDIWQGPTWSSVEYPGAWKMLHYAAAEFFAPVATSVYQLGDLLDVWVVSDLLHSVSGSLSLQVWSWSGTLQYSVQHSFVVAALSGKSVVAQPVAALLAAANCAATTDCLAVATATLHSGDTLPASKFFFSWQEGGLANVSLPPVNLTTGAFAAADQHTVSFTVHSTAVAPYVWLDVPFDGHFSSNGFLMLPDQTVAVSFTARQPVSLAAFRHALTVQSIQSAYQ